MAEIDVNGNASNYLVFNKYLRSEENAGPDGPVFLGVRGQNRAAGVKRQAGKGIYCSLCFKLSGRMECQFYRAECQKAGKQKNGAQKYYCKGCKKYQQASYVYKAYSKTTNPMICQLVCESVSIRGIARVLKISVGTVLNRIRELARNVMKPAIVMNQPELEVDELRAFVGRNSNECWVAYALNKENGEIIDFVVGKRSKRTLRMLTNTLLLSGGGTIRTDDLTIYRSLIPHKRHRFGSYCINHIEGKNLTVRTHLKRLSRRTICFSRSLLMLESCLRIYFWGRFQEHTEK